MDQAHPVVCRPLDIHYRSTVLVDTSNANATDVVTLVRVPDEVDISPTLLQDATSVLHAKAAANSWSRDVTKEDVAV